MNKQKKLWEILAKENSRYYINSDFGRGITEAQFRQSGVRDYKRLIAKDKLIKKRKNILDYGCGIGRLTEFMARDFKKVTGVDISGLMIAQAKTRLKGLKNVKFIETNGNTIPLADNSFDIVFSNLVFQHIKTRRMVNNAFKEIYRVLIPRGTFKVLMRSDKARDLNRWWSGVEYDKKSIAKVYKKIGFSLLKIEHIDKHAFWLWLQK